MKIVHAIAVLWLALGLVGCDNTTSQWRPPVGPSPVPQAAPPSGTPSLVVFTDPVTRFSTSDVRDAGEQIVQFNTAGELIWTADGMRLPGYPVHGISINAEKTCRCWFEVRFVTWDGQRLAYLTADYGHDNPGTVVDLEVRDGVLVMSRTDLFPPGTFTMSGTVTEMTPAGQRSLAGASVSYGYGSGYQGTTTDANGFYEIRGLYDGGHLVEISKAGFHSDKRVVSFTADTRLDVQLVRQ